MSVLEHVKILVNEFRMTLISDDNIPVHFAMFPTIVTRHVQFNSSLAQLSNRTCDHEIYFDTHLPVWIELRPLHRGTFLTTKQCCSNSWLCHYFDLFTGVQFILILFHIIVQVVKKKPIVISCCVNCCFYGNGYVKQKTTEIIPHSF